MQVGNADVRGIHLDLFEIHTGDTDRGWSGRGRWAVKNDSSDLVGGSGNGYSGTGVCALAARLLFFCGEI